MGGGGPLDDTAAQEIVSDDSVVFNLFQFLACNRFQIGLFDVKVCISLKLVDETERRSEAVYHTYLPNQGTGARQ